MDSVTLHRLSQSVLSEFLAVFPSDLLPSDVPGPCCFIANTQPSGTRGEHWISVFINKEGYGDYFCSYGVPPKPVFANFMKNETIDWNFSAKRI